MKIPFRVWDTAVRDTAFYNSALWKPLARGAADLVTASQGQRRFLSAGRTSRRHLTLIQSALRIL